MKKIGLIMDFVCPYCFVAEEIMWKVLEKNYKNFEFEWLPYELVPEPDELKQVTPERREYFLEKILPWAEREKIEIKFPTVNPVPRTALAFEGIYIAEESGLGCEYVRGVMEAYWLHNRDIGKIEILTEVAGEIGIDKENFKVALETGKYRQKHKIRNEEVSQWDFEVVPTFYIDGEQIPEFPRTEGEMRKIFY